MSQTTLGSSYCRWTGSYLHCLSWRAISDAGLLQDLPAVLQSFAEPGRIRQLDATNNRLQAVPDWLLQRFAGLQQLMLSYNRLAALPAEIGMLTALRVRSSTHDARIDKPGIAA